MTSIVALFVQNNVEIATVEPCDLFIARCDVGRGTAVGNVQFRDHDLGASVRDLLEEAGETALVKPAGVPSGKMASDAYGVSDDNIRIQLLAYASPNLKRRLRFRGTMVLNHRRRGPPDRSDPIRHRLACLIHETAPHSMIAGP